MNLFENAIAAIQIGIEDFESKDERRALSSVRNIFAGLVLLYKSKLWELSPQNDEYLLIRNDLIYKAQRNRILVSSKNPAQRPNKTITIFQIQERFKSLDIEVDWKLFDILKRERNDIEHFYSSSDQFLLRKTINDAFVLINDFIENHMELDVKNILGEKYWDIFLKNKNIYLQEKEKCKNSLESIDCEFEWIKPYLFKISCGKCSSDLIYLAEDSLSEFNCSKLKCRNCNNEITHVIKCVVKMIENERYDYEMSKAGWSDIGFCPSCGEESFIKGENECLSCNYEPADLFCKSCNTEVDIDDLDENSVCSYCNYKINRD
ncbi:hypothetical protein [Legionella sp.]|uniref:hypothetical protein n=1 Tax=Legionella sp. TaxID=459 RepID=UPI000CAE9426|nr:hypothetical protein [Legionella sp.]PJE14236.1 MAG: hypothetical protein CK430_05340 [Legionella sp.]